MADRDVLKSANECAKGANFYTKVAKKCAKDANSMGGGVGILGGLDDDPIL